MEWLSDVFCRVVRHDWSEQHRTYNSNVEQGYLQSDAFETAFELLTQQGRLSKRLLRHLWADLQLSDPHFEAMYYVMQQVGICFPVPHDTTQDVVFVAPLLGLDVSGEQVLSHYKWGVLIMALEAS